MFQSVSLFNLPCPWESAVPKVVRILNAAGFEVLRSFDLQTARSMQVDCVCPHHGTNACTCQVLVMLIYGQTGNFITMLAHGYEQQTHFAFGKRPEENSALENQVRQVFTENIFKKLENCTDH